ncbi:hypothetical protein BN946_scf184844.g35 [Trametes cinnabarina]|uniref:DUF6699 domain-containing protein n=1 Tax=Pycnoporus cinnabarinus TaxID=5643 RepID=A0A060S9X2_PYCCI|nr:hypothetical protein BN946_scf184844.g35 [Trametes cinnabarina]
MVPHSSSRSVAEPYVSIWDVLITLYKYLRMPIDPTAYKRLSSEEKDALHRSAADRARRKSPGWLSGADHYAAGSVIQNVDLLGERRSFLGIRVAQQQDLPQGKRFGEVFVVELGKIWT